MGITFSARTEQKQRKSLKDRDMNNQHFNTTMDSQQFFELVEVPQQQQYDYEMDSQGYSPSEVSSDHDLYVPAEDYAPCAAKKRRTNNAVLTPTPIESRPGRAPKVSDDQLSETDLERRNRRRARNREAAARQRNRRLAKVDLLEGEVAVLTESNCSLQSENKRLRAELDQLRFKMKVSPTPTKKSVKRPAPVEIKPIVADIPDQLFTPGGNFVLQTPAELKGQNFFPMETSKPDEELIKKEKQFMRQDSFSEYLNLL